MRVQRRGIERPDDRIARVRWVDDSVEPQACRRVARISLMFVGSLDGIEQFLFRLFVESFALALELLELNLGKRIGRRVAAHDCKFRRWPRKHKTWIIRFSAHGVI